MATKKLRARRAVCLARHLVACVDVDVAEGVRGAVHAHSTGELAAAGHVQPVWRSTRTELR